MRATDVRPWRHHGRQLGLRIPFHLACVNAFRPAPPSIIKQSKNASNSSSINLKRDTHNAHCNMKLHLTVEMLSEGNRCEALAASCIFWSQPLLRRRQLPGRHQDKPSCVLLNLNPCGVRNPEPLRCRQLPGRHQEKANCVLLNLNPCWICNPEPLRHWGADSIEEHIWSRHCLGSCLLA